METPHNCQHYDSMMGSWVMVHYGGGSYKTWIMGHNGWLLIFSESKSTWSYAVNKRQLNRLTLKYSYSLPRMHIDRYICWYHQRCGIFQFLELASHLLTSSLGLRRQIGPKDLLLDQIITLRIWSFSVRHLQCLIACFNRFMDGMKFLRNIMSADRLCPDTEKLKAAKDWSRPASVALTALSLAFRERFRKESSSCVWYL
jgi:hypothetical protein